MEVFHSPVLPRNDWPAFTFASEAFVSCRKLLRSFYYRVGVVEVKNFSSYFFQGLLFKAKLRPSAWLTRFKSLFWFCSILLPFGFILHHKNDLLILKKQFCFSWWRIAARYFLFLKKNNEKGQKRNCAFTTKTWCARINYDFFIFPLLFFWLRKMVKKTKKRRAAEKCSWQLKMQLRYYPRPYITENSLMRGPELSVARRSESCEWKRTFPKHSKDISSGSFVQVKIEQKQPSSSLFAYGSTIRLSLSYSLSLELILFS